MGPAPRPCLDIAGGWTDTPPYTNRYGGAVVNLAVDLNGQSPIQVFVRRTSESRIRIHSIDLGLTETIGDTEGLKELSGPGLALRLAQGRSGPFGAGRARRGTPLGSLGAAGGRQSSPSSRDTEGLRPGHLVDPRGNQLGALERFFGLPSAADSLFLQVLEMEQMLTTGGGWQDQIGGLAGGVKYIESRPGLKPRPSIHQLDPWAFRGPVGHWV